MASPQAGPYSLRRLLAVRASLLNADGSPRCNLVNGSAWSPCPQSLTPATQTSADQTAELRCGDGSIADQDTVPGAVTGYQVTLVISKQDFELAALLTGATVIFDPLDSTRVIGFADPEPSAAVDPVELDVWALNRSNNANAPSPYQYQQIAFPFVRFRLGDDALGEDYSVVTLIGLATPNNAIGGGTFDDFPMDATGRARLRWATDVIPDAAVSPYSANPSGGYIDTPACLS
jgi:hypothetical protein